MLTVTKMADLTKNGQTEFMDLTILVNFSQIYLREISFNGFDDFDGF